MNTFSLLSYNILADSYANSSLFPAVNPKHLSLTKRWNLLLSQLQTYRSDILCLQEVELHAKGKSFMSHVIDRVSKSIPYRPQFVKRNGKKQDGVAICFNSQKFELLESESVYFNDIADEIAAALSSHSPSFTPSPSPSTSSSPFPSPSFSSSPLLPPSSSPSLSPSPSPSSSPLSSSHQTSSPIATPPNSSPVFPSYPSPQSSPLDPLSPPFFPVGNFSDTEEEEKEEEEKEEGGDESARIVFVASVPPQMEEAKLAELLSIFGKIENLKIVRSKKPKNFAFVTYFHKSSCDAAIRYKTIKFRKYTLSLYPHIRKDPSPTPSVLPAVSWYRRHNVGLVCVLRPRDARKKDIFEIYEDEVDETYRRFGLSPTTSTPLSSPLPPQERTLIVATCHLYYNPEFPDVKLMQVFYLLQKIERLRAKYANASVVLCGDFNSLPESLVYRLITNGTLSFVNWPSFCTSCRTPRPAATNAAEEDGAEKENSKDPPPSAPPLSSPSSSPPSLGSLEDSLGKLALSPSPPSPSSSAPPSPPSPSSPSSGRYCGVCVDVLRRLRLPFTFENDESDRVVGSHVVTIDFRSKIAFRSVYENWREGGGEGQEDGGEWGEPLYTNYTSAFNGCLDYIFYSDGVTHTRLLSIPDLAKLGSTPEIGLPSAIHPSDHLPLGASFVFT